MALVLQLLLYLAAVAGVVAGSLGFIFFLGGALNRARDPAIRRRRALYAALCLLGVVLSATLGFVGVAWIMYLAQQ